MKTAKRIGIGVAGIVVLLVLAANFWPVKPLQRPQVLQADFHILAHGAGMGLGPRNTIETAYASLTEGATVIELDIRETTYGEIVVIHDETVTSLTGISGAVAEMTLSELQALDAGSEFTAPDGTHPYRNKGVRVPTLMEMFIAIPDSRYVIEIKPADSPIPGWLCKTIRGQGLGNRVIVGSFHDSALNEFRATCPEIATSMASNEVRAFVYLQKLGLWRLAPTPGQALQVPEEAAGIRIVTPGFIAAAHARGLAVHVWTVNDPDDMRRLIHMGVDGIITDYPGRLAAVLE